MIVRQSQNAAVEGQSVWEQKAVQKVSNALCSALCDQDWQPFVAVSRDSTFRVLNALPDYATADKYLT